VLLEIAGVIEAVGLKIGWRHRRFRTIGRRPSGPRAVDPTREYVFGGRMPEPITEGQRKAVVRLTRANRELGADGAALVHEVLVLGMTMEQVGQRRGLRTQRWSDYFARRLRQCLDRLALIYGLRRSGGSFERRG
jgi:hypothetical protein